MPKNKDEDRDLKNIPVEQAGTLTASEAAKFVPHDVKNGTKLPSAPLTRQDFGI